MERFNSSEPLEDEPKSIPPAYRTKHNGVTPQEGCKTLDDIEIAASQTVTTHDEADTQFRTITEEAAELNERINESVVVDDDYEYEISHMREMIEDASRYMSVGNFRQNVPRNVIKHFKDTMKRMNAIIALNKQARREGSEDAGTN